MLGSNPGLFRLRHWHSDAPTTRLDLIGFGFLINSIPNIFLPIQDTPEAQKDPRYLEVWLKYAAISAQPLEVYDYMFKNGKCSQQAGLYDAWAWHLESQAHYKLAEKIYSRGIDALTDREAKAGLEQRKQQFQAARCGTGTVGTVTF